MTAMQQLSLTERNRKLFKEGILTDVTFVVGQEKQRIPAHKGILASSNSVFFLLFNEKSKDESSEIPIMDVNPSDFKTLLEFIYTDEDPQINSDNWASLLYASEKYRLPSLLKRCESFVEESVLTVSAFKLFSQARKYQVHDHVSFLRNWIAYHADKLLSSDSLFDIENKETLAEILSFDKLNCDEILVFRAAMRWASARCEQNEGLRDVLGQAFYSIRFSRISINKFQNEVIPKDVLTDEEILCVIKKKDLGPFNTNSRVRICNRFNEHKVSTLKTNDHAIKFKVNHSIKIYGFLINIPHDESVNELCGRILLKEENSKALGDKSFNIMHNNVFKSTTVCFTKPVIINPETVYTASVHFDSNDFTTDVGINGQSKVVTDGVEWTFVNDDSSCSETNITKGQLPAFEFSR